MQTHINPATDQLPASAVITLDKPEQFRTGQLNVETLTLDDASHVRFSGSNWADGGKFMERDYDYFVNSPLLRGDVRAEAMNVSQQIQRPDAGIVRDPVIPAGTVEQTVIGQEADPREGPGFDERLNSRGGHAVIDGPGPIESWEYAPKQPAGPGPDNWAASTDDTIMPPGLGNLEAAAWIDAHTPDPTSQIITEATDPELTNKVLPLNPKASAWDNGPVPTRAEQLWRKDNPTRDDVVNNIAGQLAASGTPDADAFRVGENFMSMYDDPKAAMASWQATIERQGIAPAQTIAANWDDPLPLTRDQAANKIADELVAGGRPEMDAMRIGNLRVNQAASAGLTPDQALEGFQAERAATRTAVTQPVSADFLQGLPRETPTAGQAQQVNTTQQALGVPKADQAASHWAASLERNGGGTTVSGRASVDQGQLNASMARHPSGRMSFVKK